MNTQTLVATESVFQNCSARNSGGCAYVTQSTELSEVVFANCSAGAWHSGVSLFTSNLSARRCLFRDSHGQYGSAFDASAAVVVVDSVIEHCSGDWAMRAPGSALLRGVVVRNVTGTALSSWGSLTIISDSSFSSVQGGYPLISATNLEMKRTYLTNCDGFVRSQECNLTDVHFINCSSQCKILIPIFL